MVGTYISKDIMVYNQDKHMKKQSAWIITDKTKEKILTFVGNRLDPISKLSLNEHVFWDRGIAESRNKFLSNEFMIVEVKITLEVLD